MAELGDINFGCIKMCFLQCICGYLLYTFVLQSNTIQIPLRLLMCYVSLSGSAKMNCSDEEFWR